jgi:chorismate mutase
MREQAIINRIALLQSRKRENGNIVKKLQRQLMRIRGTKQYD